MSMKHREISILLFLVCPALNAQTVSKLADVKIIHVGDIGGSDRAEAFRSFVGKELSDRGFIVTESENAETTLSGVLSVTREQDASGVSTGGVITQIPSPRLLYECRVMLKNRDGLVLWQWEGSSGSKRFWQTMELEPVASLAVKLALKFEKDYQKASKKTGDRRQKTELPVNRRARAC